MKKTFLSLGVALLLCGCASTPSQNNLTLSGLNPANFEKVIENNQALKLYTLKNANGVEVCITNFGARIVSIMVPDKNGEMQDVVLGFDNIEDYITNLLEEIQDNIFKKALDFRESRTVKVDTWEDFKTQIENNMFVYAHWDGTPETEQKIKDETKATIRCIPLDDDFEDGKCIYSGQPSTRRVIFARAY